MTHLRQRGSAALRVSRIRPAVALGCALAAILTPTSGAAQDPFAIEVYGSEMEASGSWDLGAHFSYAAVGTTAYDGSLAPTEHQGRFALELTRGVTDSWEVAAYALMGSRPGAGVENAGWRLRSRVRLPEMPKLAGNVSVGLEVGFYPAAYGENAIALEIRPIFAKRIGRVEMRLNPAVERGLKGRDTTSASGWEFEPSARVAVSLSQRIDLSVEYYGKTALLDSAVPSGAEVHQFFPGLDLKLGEDIALNLGVGFGTTSAGNRLVFKSGLDVPLGN